jgi:hypothetical protein
LFTCTQLGCFFDFTKRKISRGKAGLSGFRIGWISLGLREERIKKQEERGLAFLK